MIDVELYRARIGNYLPSCKEKRRNKTKDHGSRTAEFSFLKSDNSASSGLWILYLIIILYLAAIFLGMICDTQTSDSISNINYMLSYKYFTQSNCMELVKYFYIIIFAFIMRYLVYNSRLRDSVLYRMYIVGTRSKNRISRLSRGIQCFLIWISILNFLLITIVNPSMLNPGPTTAGQSVSVFYLNARGLIPWGELNNKHPTLHTTKLHDLNLYIEHNKPDIVIYNETWLKPSISDNEVIPTDKYKVFRLDRCTFTHPPDPNNADKFAPNGGGVLIGIRHDLDIQSKLISVKCRAEIICIELTDKRGRKTILSTLYRVGTLGIENHSRVDQHLRNIRRRRKVDELILIGDLNMRYTDWETGSSNGPTEQLFLDTFNDLSLSQVISLPTHKQGNILDIILTDKPEHIHDIKVDNDSGFGGSDHYPLFCNLKLNARRKTSKKRCIFNFNKANWDGISTEFLNTNWDSILSLSGSTMDEAWSAFKTKFVDATERHIPKIKINDAFQPPWYDSEVHELSKKKRFFHKRWKKSRSDLHYAKFAECRKQFKNLVEKKMEDNFEDENNRNLITKKFWSYVKSKSNSHRIPEVVNYDNRLRSNTRDQCELFNEYFINQFSAPSTYNIGIDFTNDHLFEVNFNPDIIREHLLAINPNKAQGPDLIHGRILKTCANSLAYPLSRLFKLSYETGNIPTDWKLANVVPVHKKGSKSEVNNYRPISLTSLVMKLYERVIRDELLSRCNHLIDQRQHGFLAQKSCCTQMVDFCDSLALSLNDNIRSDVIYFDFQKAFDSVNHDIILKKLKYQYKIDGSLLRFFLNYLKDRSQRVVIGNEQSSTLRVNSGVPQGSILGPIIFILFLNDITEGLSEGTSIRMYADDTKIWRRINKADDHYILQRDIDHLLNWATRNMMTFHPDKCKTLAVTNGHRPDTDFIYSMSDKAIDYTTLVKDLGIHINGKLNWNEHSEIIYSRANQRLGLLKRTCDFVKNKSKRRALYISMVRSQFEHCAIVWRPSAQSALDRLESIQKRALKWVNDDAYTSFTRIGNYYKMCKQFDILPISFRFDFRDLMFFHSVFYSYSVTKLPDYLQRFTGSRLRRSHYDRLSIVSSIIPRIPQNLNTENSSLGISKSFFYRAHLAWNKLPLDLRDNGAPSKFKTALLVYMWGKVSNIIKYEYEYDKQA